MKYQKNNVSIYTLISSLIPVQFKKQNNFLCNLKPTLMCPKRSPGELLRLLTKQYFILKLNAEACDFNKILFKMYLDIRTLDFYMLGAFFSACNKRNKYQYKKKSVVELKLEKILMINGQRAKFVKSRDKFQSV